MSDPTPQEIRELYADFSSEWNDIREEAKTDMRFVSGDPWEASDRKAREDAKRPCISLDELNQYLNQAINNIRQNKRAPLVLPKGEGSNDQDGDRRADIIRGIERESHGQGAYITAFENALQRSYGFAGIVNNYTTERSFDQKLSIRRFPNPDCVLITPNFKEADASDIDEAFVTDKLSKKAFKRKYPGAKAVSFNAELAKDPLLGKWVSEDHILTAEFWRINKTEVELLMLDGGAGDPIIVFEEELKAAPDNYKQLLAMQNHGKEIPIKVLKQRKSEKKSVKDYITNGVEIIDEESWLGSRIPICAVFGKELFVDDGGGSKRVLLSMVRLARDPQMLLAYLASLECEEAGQVPKTPFVGAKGQFESDQEAWEFITKIPRGYVQYDPVPDPMNPGAGLPPPSRPQYEPHFQEYEIAKDSARRSIQAAMGITPLPTAAQRMNAKSGVALEKIQTQEAIGSYHFTDNYDAFLENIGFQLNEGIGKYYDTARSVPVTKKDGTHSVMRINDAPYELQNPNAEHVHVHKDGEDAGEYGVTISTGPSYESQREEASSFVDTLIENWQALGLAPTLANQILALGIRLKNLGPIGEQIAELLQPPDQNQIPPQARAAMLQAQGVIQQLQQVIAKLTMERDAKVLDHQARIELEKIKQDSGVVLALLDRETKLAVAEVGTKAQDLSERREFVADVFSQVHSQAHEVGIQANEHAHQRDQADVQRQIAQAEAQTAAQSQPGQPAAPDNGGTPQV